MTNELQYEQIKEEFDTFVYIASHDLRAPLRQINSFINLFLDSFNMTLSDDQELYKKMLFECVDDADNIIDTLLQYSRIELTPDSIKEFNVSEAYDHAVEKLSDKIKDQSVQITFNSSDIKIHADITLISHIFYHLIDNSIKFHKENTPPIIHVDVTADGDYVDIRIKDNGIGLPASKAELATTILRQLHPKGKYDGSGAGLAIVKKITFLHHGSLEVTSPHEDGAEILARIKANA